ncbi:hypothetical protein HOY34_10925 [Xinfangfangia sp. D13-10-4-6]|uniref:hypothetical protein n=1 Tax=Pseudogemmobacter hezensis TaxID=2737662 RepID=UPI0015559C72|nr:hypothetical protein [Pseudogemmobacter hezensis]NPD15715.1 hypothetical protein [Pseudogemmobacter hezensis]
MSDHIASADAVALSTLGLDVFETGLLAVTRHFMTAFARPESQAWQNAYAIAAERWGQARGPQIAHGLLAVIQALRQARQEDFHYANPLCISCREQATPEEAAFCLMLHAMRRDRADLARTPVLEVTGGRMDPMLIQVALSFCARFPAAEERHDIAPGCQSGRQDDLPQRPSLRPTHRPGGRHLRLVH